MIINVAIVMYLQAASCIAGQGAVWSRKPKSTDVLEENLARYEHLSNEEAQQTGVIKQFGFSTEIERWVFSNDGVVALRRDTNSIESDVQGSCPAHASRRSLSQRENVLDPRRVKWWPAQTHKQITVFCTAAEVASKDSRISRYSMLTRVALIGQISLAGLNCVRAKLLSGRIPAGAADRWATRVQWMICTAYPVSAASTTSNCSKLVLTLTRFT